MNPDKSFGLSERTLTQIRQVLGQHPGVRSAVIYGSRAKGTYKTGSDIDLTLHGDTLQYEDLMAINESLDELLLPYEIDLSLFKEIDNASLREHIERVGQVLYARTTTLS